MAEVSHKPEPIAQIGRYNKETDEWDYKPEYSHTWHDLPEATRNYKAELLYPLARLAIDFAKDHVEMAIPSISDWSAECYLQLMGLIPDKTEKE